MWFKNGVHHPYNGGITKDEIVKWVTKNSVSSSTLVDCETLKNKAEQVEEIVAYIGDLDNALYKRVHLPIADLNAQVKFFHVQDDAACAKEHLLSSGQGLVYIKNFDEPMIPYTGAADKLAFSNWISPLMVPKIFETNNENFKFYQENTIVLTLFRDNAIDNDAAFMNVFTQAA